MQKTGGKTIIGIVLALLIGAAVIAVLAVAGSFIGKEAAERIAYKDAGVEPPYSRTELEFENGHFQYEVEFYVNGIEYEYQILAKDGSLLHRNTKGSGVLVPQEDVPQKTATEPPTEAPAEETETETQAPTEAPTEAPAEAPTEAPTEAPAEAETQPEAQQTQTNNSDAPPPSQEVIDHAKIIALSNMGLMDKQNEVVFTDEQWVPEGEGYIFTFKMELEDTEYEAKVNSFGALLEQSSKPKAN